MNDENEPDTTTAAEYKELSVKLAQELLTGSGQLNALGKQLKDMSEELEATQTILGVLVKQLGGAVRISGANVMRHSEKIDHINVTRDKSTGDIWVKLSDDPEEDDEEGEGTE